MNNQKNLGKDYRFVSKWSPAITQFGFTAVPNILLTNYQRLGITKPELLMIIMIDFFRWEDDEPFPSLERLAKLNGISERQARSIITSLHDKAIIIRKQRDYQTNTYNFDRLIFKLDQIAISCLPPGRKLPPTMEETRHGGGIKTSPYEYAAINTPQISPTMNTGIKSVGNILRGVDK